LTNTGSEAKIEILGGSLAAVERVIEVGKRRKGRNLRYVCVCGHSEGAHSADDSLVHCQVGNVWCSCKYPSWVLLAENVRHFAHKTNGAGPNHALSKGIVSTQKAGYSLESLIKQECWMCNTPTDELVAVALIVREGTVRPAFDFDGQANTLWCRGCCDENRVSIWYPLLGAVSIVGGNYPRLCRLSEPSLSRTPRIEKIPRSWKLKSRYYAWSWIVVLEGADTKPSSILSAA
jgi:hypothetical protein